VILSNFKQKKSPVITGLWVIQDNLRSKQHAVSLRGHCE
jgi:hypothetical protein